MRKLILISALLLASASVQASESRGLQLAANDTPAATTDTAQPLPPVNQADTSKPQTSEPAAQPRTPRPHAQVRRHEGDEAKARRIAAKYGVYW
jgi:hypothetical protein